MTDQPRRYRRRGLSGHTVVAWQVAPGNLEAVAAWCHGRVDDGAVRPNRSMIPAYPGDYVVQALEGDYWYTAVQDLFEMYHQLA